MVQVTAVLTAVMLALSVLSAGLYGWYQSRLWTQSRLPSVPRQEIGALLDQPVRTEEEYRILTEQTGLAPFAVEDMLAAGRKRDILRIQEARYTEDEVLTRIIGFPVWEERLVSLRVPLAELEDGDILITSSARLLGWRMGHCALVVDADRGLTLEAMGYGVPSALLPLSDWQTRPDFVVLRPNLEASVRTNVAEHAKETLVGVPTG